MTRAYSPWAAACDEAFASADWGTAQPSSVRGFELGSIDANPEFIAHARRADPDISFRFADLRSKSLQSGFESLPGHIQRQSPMPGTTRNARLPICRRMPCPPQKPHRFLSGCADSFCRAGVVEGGRDRLAGRSAGARESGSVETQTATASPGGQSQMPVSKTDRPSRARHIATRRAAHGRASPHFIDTTREVQRLPPI